MPARKVEPSEEIAPVPVDDAPSTPPTFAEAFALVSDALRAHHLALDEMPQALGADTLQRLYADGNHAIAWQKALLALEVALGCSLHSR